MKCPHCGALVSEDRLFCPACLVDVPRPTLITRLWKGISGKVTGPAAHSASAWP